jgi:hypothetical protein
MLAIGTRHSVGLPMQVYPLYENGFRARRAQTLKENTEESASLYAEFDKIATQNPFSWNYGHNPKSPEEIGTPSEKNRKVSVPCAFFACISRFANLSSSELF